MTGKALLIAAGLTLAICLAAAAWALVHGPVSDVQLPTR